MSEAGSTGLSFAAPEYTSCYGITEKAKHLFTKWLHQHPIAILSKSMACSLSPRYMNTFAVNSSGIFISNATNTKAVDLPDAGMMNVMTALDAAGGQLLIADAYNR